MIWVLRVACLAGAATCTGAESLAQSLYIAQVNLLDEGYVSRMNMDGSGFETLYETTGGLRGLALAPDRNEAYLSDVDFGVIYRVRFDTFTDRQDLVAGLTFPADLAVDLQRDAITWTDAGPDLIARSRLDGSDQRVLVQDDLSIAIAIDENAGVAYFEDRDSASRGAIRRVGLDGTGLATVIDDVPTATDIALDTEHSYIYWGSSAGFDGTGGIYRVMFDGSGFEQIFVSDHFNFDATTVALDLVHGQVYFAADTSTTTEGIYRMGLDGTDPTLIRDGFDGITDITYLVPPPAALSPLALAALSAARRRR